MTCLIEIHPLSYFLSSRWCTFQVTRQYTIFIQPVLVCPPKSELLYIAGHVISLFVFSNKLIDEVNQHQRKILYLNVWWLWY